MRAEDIRAVKELTILAESEEAGVFLAIADEGRKIFVMGHPEYDRVTLDKEYKRDKDKGLDIKMPVNYYPNDDDTQKPRLQWRCTWKHSLFKLAELLRVSDDTIPVH